jgi:hypothetical protein
VIQLFDSEEDYQRASEVLEAMLADETPGRHTAVMKYEVAHRQFRPLASHGVTFYWWDRLIFELSTGWLLSRSRRSRPGRWQ